MVKPGGKSMGNGVWLGALTALIWVALGIFFWVARGYWVITLITLVPAAFFAFKAWREAQRQNRP